MGYDQHQQSSSSGATAAVIVGVVLFAILGLLVVAAAGLFWVRSSSLESHALQATVAEAQAGPMIATVSAEPVSINVQLDHEGTIRINGEEIELDALNSRLTTLKNESGGRLDVQVGADSDCLFKHVISVLDLCAEVGGINYRVVSSGESTLSSDEVSTSN